jgi:ElaA protein
MNWSIKSFQELSVEEWHDLLALRIAIFVVEQNCPYQEVDGKDKVSYHVFAQDKQNTIVAVARIVPPGVSYKEWSIGRVAIAEDFRGLKLGYALMEQSIAFIQEKEPNAQIRISAQSHLQQFYENLGFVFTGKAYDEDGIPHIEMLR